MNKNKSRFQIYILLINLRPMSDTLKTKKKFLKTVFLVIIEGLADQESLFFLYTLCTPFHKSTSLIICPIFL